MPHLRVLVSFSLTRLRGNEDLWHRSLFFAERPEIVLENAEIRLRLFLGMY